MPPQQQRMMNRFDASTLRDPEWKRRFYEKLAAVRAIQKDHTFLGYVAGQQEIDELIRLYEENYAWYQHAYLHHVQALESFKQSLEQLRPSLFPIRYAELLPLIHRINHLLDSPYYDDNAQAGALIEQAQSQLETFVAEWKETQDTLTAFESEVQQQQGALWQETVDTLTDRCAQIRTQMRGDLLPDLGQLDRQQITQDIEARKQATASLLAQARFAPRYKARIRQWEGQPLKKETYEQVATQLRRRKKRRGVLGVSFLILVVLGGVWAVSWLPEIYHRYHEQRAWKAAQETGSYEAYQHFIDAYPNDTYTALAKDALRRLPEGVIDSFVNAGGRVFRYEGQLHQGFPQGTGQAFFPNGDRYLGTWEKGVFQGKGTYHYAHGGVYEGSWSLGKQHGQGTLHLPDGSSYQGQWENGYQSGKGTLVKADQGRYTGAWKEGKFHGSGTYLYPDSSRYEGEWVQGSRQGQGKYWFNDSSYYSGSWMEDQRSGEGTYVWPDGRKYTGLWKNDRFHGEGTLQWPNGSVFTGKWVNGNIDGPGKFTSRFRETFDGIFKEGEEERISFYDEDGTFIRSGYLSNGLFIAAPPRED